MRHRSPEHYGSLVFAAIAILAIAGCATNAPPYSPPEKPTTQTVFILPFEVDPTALYGGRTDFGVLLAEYLAGALQEKGVAALVISREESRPDAHYLVAGRISDLDPGSWNLRFWIGFGAGRALVNAEAELLVAGHSTPAYKETRRARSLTYLFEENILRRTCARIARTFAKEIASAIKREPAA